MNKEISNTYRESDALEENRTFKDRVRKIVGDQAIREFARIAGVSEGALRQYLSGKSEPGLQALIGLANAGKVAVQWLATGEEPIKPGGLAREEQGAGPLEAFALVPIYDVEVSAGPGREVIEEEPASELAFRRDWLADMGLHASKCVAVKARGDSMSPTIEDGDVLLVDRTVPDGRRDGIYIMSQQGMLRVKRVQWLSDGNVRLGSDNTAYAEELVYGEGVGRLKFVGRVVWGGRRF